MRTFKKCYPTQRWQIFRHYEPDIHFFVSCVDDPQASSALILLEDYENVYCERYTDPVLPEIPIEKGFHAPYANAASHRNLMLQHWGNQRVYQFFCERKGDTAFDMVIRIRPDIWIHRFQPVFPRQNICISPWWGKFGGINDRLAILGKDAATYYFNVYDIIDSLLGIGCPFHPETILAEALRMGGIVSQSTLLTEFSTERMDGSRRWAEITNSDIAELITAIR